MTKTVTLKLVFEMSEAIKQIISQARNIQTPWLAIHGDEDKIALPEGSKQLIEILGSQDKQFVVLKGSRHEVHNEIGNHREQFLRLLANWIIERSDRAVP